MITVKKESITISFSSKIIITNPTSILSGGPQPLTHFLGRWPGSPTRRQLAQAFSYSYDFSWHNGGKNTSLVL